MNTLPNEQEEEEEENFGSVIEALGALGALGPIIMMIRVYDYMFQALFVLWVCQCTRHFL